ncbi:MAG: diaminopimelate epimerase [Chitinophagaceae bacterium]|nr:MAG: diaminopimelate epimerase [Chitinophagaceae bacterium]
MKFSFYKYHGTGNDFVILDNREGAYNDLTPRQVKFICERRFGIGADGLMLLNLKTGYDFEMVYYNADGNPSSMCGNGGRCLVKFAHDVGLRKLTYKFLAIDGDHEAELDGRMVRLKMKDVNAVDEHASYAVLNTGSPHYVKFVSNLDATNVTVAGRAIRNSDDYVKEGINVNFVENVGDDAIYVRTYERGVEGETLSCGTGVTAASLVSAHNERGFNRVEVKTMGGNLSVEFNKLGDHEFTDVWLCGPATFVYKGEIEIPA